MSELLLPRRKFLFGLTGIFAAPAIIKASSLMKVAAVSEETDKWWLKAEVYGRSPAMNVLPDIVEWQRFRMSWNDWRKLNQETILENINVV